MCGAVALGVEIATPAAALDPNAAARCNWSSETVVGSRAQLERLENRIAADSDHIAQLLSSGRKKNVNKAAKVARNVESTKVQVALVQARIDRLDRYIHVVCTSALPT